MESTFIREILDYVSGTGSGLIVLLLLWFMWWFKGAVAKWAPVFLEKYTKHTIQLERQNDLLERVEKVIKRCEHAGP